MVKITLISEDIDDVTGKPKRIKLKVSFWSVMKMYIIAWFIVTAFIIGITLIARSVIDGLLI